MRLDASQNLRMDQRMKLAPRMIQSMEILAMPQQALEERIEQELASNPTLELREAGVADRQTLEAEREQSERDSSEGERELVVTDDSGNNADDFERLDNISQEYGESWDTNTYSGAGQFDFTPSRGSRSYQGERDGKLDAMANTAARGQSLFEQLMAQWRLVETTDELAAAGEFIISQIDADGYLRVSNRALMDQAPAGVTQEQLDQAIDLIQRSIEPPGIGARDLRECLLLQIDAKEAAEPQVDLSNERLLVEDHLKNIEVNRMPTIAKATGLSVDQINDAIRSLRQFHPHPGKLLAEDQQHTITPDAIIEYDEVNDTYTATLTRSATPSLHLSAIYRKMAAANQTDKSTRDFVNQNMRNARWLIDAIEQRASTLERVINVVLAAQRDFFDQGPSALKPLPMTLVADQLGIHVATVSRAVNEKYLQTPRGIFPLRMFFSGGTETESGDAMSWTAVQAKLKQIIDDEDKQNPLSDDQLVEELKSHGIDIARRTVAKYRKQLNLPTARQRKKYA